jgi:hypothetical protein
VRVTGSAADYSFASGVVFKIRLNSGGSPWLVSEDAPPAATQHEFRGLTNATSYIVGIAYRGVTGVEGPVRELAAVTTGTLVAGEAGTASGIVGQGPWATETTPVGVVTLGNPNLIKDSSFLAGVGSSFSSNWSSTGGWYRQDVFGLGSFAQIVASGTQVLTTADFETVSAGQVFSLQAEFRCGGLAAAAGCIDDVIWTNISGLAGIIGYSASVGLNGAEYAAALATSKPGGWVRRTSSSSGLVAPAGATRAYVRVYVVGTNTDSGVRNIKMEQGTVCTLWTDDKLKPRESGADVTGGNTAAGFIGQGNIAGTNIYRQSTPPSSPQENDQWYDTSTSPVSIRRRVSGAWLFEGEEGADITAQAVPSMEGPTSISFDVDGAGALSPGSQVPRTLQFIRKRGNTDVSTSTTWSIVSPVNVTLGTITNGGVNVTAVAAGLSNFTVRSVRDGVTIDHLVNVQKNTIAAGVNPPDIRKGQVVDDGTLGYASSTGWATILSANLPNCPGGYFGTDGFYTALTATGNVTVEARLTVNGTQVGSIFTGKVLAIGGTPQFADFSDVLGQFLSIASGNRTVALQFRAPSTTGTINTGDGQFIVNIVPTA